MRGKSFVIVEAVFVGSESEGAALVAPLRELDPVMDTFAAVGPTALQHLHMDPPHPVPGVGDGLFLERLPDEAIDAIVRTGVPPLVSLEIRQLGGAMASSAQHHGAVGTLDAGYVMFAVGMAPTPEIAAAVGEAVDLVKAGLAPWESARTYFNFAERQIGGARLYPLKTYTYQRLRKIRATHDRRRDVRLQSPDPAGRRYRCVADFERTSVRRPPRCRARGARGGDGRGRGRRGHRGCHGRRVRSTVYLIEEGEAEVIGAGGPTPVTLGPGDTFGEIALLLTAGERTATVVARTPMRLLALSGPDFERIRGESRSSSAPCAASGSSAPRGRFQRRRASSPRSSVDLEKRGLRNPCAGTVSRPSGYGLASEWPDWHHPDGRGGGRSERGDGPRVRVNDAGNG